MDHRGFPAHAGMDPGCVARARMALRLPRTRGDGPFHLMLLDKETEASPRGWTPERVVAGSRGRAAERGLCRPRTLERQAARHRDLPSETTEPPQSGHLGFGEQWNGKYG